MTTGDLFDALPAPQRQRELPRIEQNPDPNQWPFEHLDAKTLKKLLDMTDVGEIRGLDAEYSRRQALKRIRELKRLAHRMKKEHRHERPGQQQLPESTPEEDAAD